MSSKRKRQSSESSIHSSDHVNSNWKRRRVDRTYDGEDSDPISPISSPCMASSPLPSDVQSLPSDANTSMSSTCTQSSPQGYSDVHSSPRALDSSLPPLSSSPPPSTDHHINLEESEECELEKSHSSTLSGTHLIDEESNTVSYMGQLTPQTPAVDSKVLRMPECSTWSNFRKMSVGTALSTEGPPCPVPDLVWTNRVKFWEIMCAKDESSIQVRNADLFDYQPNLRPRMRAILLDWISEVSDVYHLHRETYYLTMDYIDRYLSVVPNIQKQQLQLIGVTCLYIASKVEEIYPPKIEVFASVTDGACTKEEIFAMEISVLQHLQWLLSPTTVNCWLEMLLQFIYRALGKIDPSSNLLLPAFSGLLLGRLCQLLDLALLDISSLRFSYGILATSAIYILVDPELAISISGLTKEDVEPCVQWMTVFWQVLKSQFPEEMSVMGIHVPLGLPSNFFNEHNPMKQKHTTNMDLCDLAQAQFELLNQQQQQKCSTSASMLTPPPSCSKTSAGTTPGTAEKGFFKSSY